MKRLLDQSFFLGDTLSITENLIGKYLVRARDGGEVALMINEVEAYDGPDDKACHACRGKTARTEIMFGEGGYFYVYFVYGIHWMLNIVTGSRDYPAAVLIRGAGDINGPARLTKHLGIDRALNKKVAAKDSGLWFEDRGIEVASSEIIKTPRIGVDYAKDGWAEKPYRFFMKK